MPADFGSLIAGHANTYGVDPNLMTRIMRIESGGNPNARTGSYSGLFQLSAPEFNKYGGGNIYDPNDNARAAAAKTAAEMSAFRQQYGRDPTATDIYMVHQQGAGGYGAHMRNPDAPAWQNMASTAEGRAKGDAWARQAIWGNVPDQLKANYPGGVDSLTSKDFVELWRNKVEGGGAAPTSAPAPASFGSMTPAAPDDSAAPAAAPRPQGNSMMQMAMGTLGALGAPARPEETPQVPPLLLPPVVRRPAPFSYRS